MPNIISILTECEAMLEGHFLLSSGKHSPQYFQCAKLMQYPQKAKIVVAKLAQQINNSIKNEDFKVDAIIGPAMGGIVVAYELGRQLEVPAFFTERDESGKMVLRRGFEIKEGEKIIIAEDVITTGRSTLEAAEAIEKLGGEIVATVCIVDRRPEDSKNPFQWPIFSALRQAAILWDVEDCEFCKNNEEAVKPGSRKI